MYLRFLLLLAVFQTGFAYSQEMEEKNVDVGDFVVFGKCTGKNQYKFIDKYKKSRVVDTAATYDTASGEGFYAYFFSEGDFDPSKLPGTYKGKQFKIISLEVFTDKNTKEDRRVLFIKLEDKNAIAWVEFDKAIESGELIIP